MKTFNELMQEIRATQSRINSNDAKVKALADRLYTNGIKSRIGAEQKATEELKAVSDEIFTDKLTLAILKSNARIALFTEVITVACEILKRYEGKPYGEKTRQKISDEVKARTNCRFYINYTYSSTEYKAYSDIPGSDYDFTAGTEYTNGSKKPLLVDNKIQAIDPGEIALYYVSREYVEDIPGQIAALIATHQKAIELQTELENTCKAFNNLAVGNIPHISVDGRISKRFHI